MNKILKFLHHLGVIMFLGSIFTYLLISILTKDGSLENLVFASRIIRSGSLFLTIPGMWLILITGIAMTIRGYGFFKFRWLNIKHLLITIIALNAHLIIVPATGDALKLATESLVEGKSLPDYHSAYIKESIFGALNILMIIVSMVAGIWRFRKQ